MAYVTHIRDVQRIVILDLGLFNNFITNITTDDSHSIFAYIGSGATSHDRLIARGIAYIEKILIAAPTLTSDEVIELVLKKGYKTQYLESTWLAAVKTAFDAALKYNDGVSTWDQVTGAELALDVGSYAIFVGIAKAIGAIEIVT